MMPFVKELSEEFPEITFAKFDTTGKSSPLLSCAPAKDGGENQLFF